MTNNSCFRSTESPQKAKLQQVRREKHRDNWDSWAGDWERAGNPKTPSPSHGGYLKQILWEAKYYGREFVGNSNNNNNVGKSSKGSHSKSKGAGGMLACKWGETASPGIYKAQLQVWD